ncbi:UNVERIFIED_CONTAM: hypothetical protein GTU68_026605 [Idotea baltica]|nr:hypothetical protein [Idotea baltica]
MYILAKYYFMSFLNLLK